MPVRDLLPGIEQVVKPAYAQAFSPQAAIEALCMCVLRRFARLNVHQLDLALNTPGQKMQAG